MRVEHVEGGVQPAREHAGAQRGQVVAGAEGQGHDVGDGDGLDPGRGAQQHLVGAVQVEELARVADVADAAFTPHILLLVVVVVVGDGDDGGQVALGDQLRRGEFPEGAARVLDALEVQLQRQELAVQQRGAAGPRVDLQGDGRRQRRVRSGQAEHDRRPDGLEGHLGQHRAVHLQEHGQRVPADRDISFVFYLFLKGGYSVQFNKTLVENPVPTLAYPPQSYACYFERLI